MGFLDFLFNKERAEERRIAKLKKTATHMYVQAAERQYAFQSLAEIGTPESTLALLARFNENSPNSTTDADEKEQVYGMLVDMARNPNLDVVGIIKTYLHAADEKVNWPLRVLTDLLTYDEMIEVVGELLEGCEVDYQRNPEKKQELVLRASEFKSPRLAEQVVRFLGDDNETIRFLAVEAAIKQEQDELVEEPLRHRLAEEDSLRVVKKLLEIFADRPEWIIPEEEREDVALALVDEYGIHKDGYIYKKRN